MGKPKYPNETLRRVRTDRVDRAVLELAKAISERDAAEKRQRAAEAVKADHERAAEEKRAAERAALLGGALRVADLMRKDAWEFGVRTEGDKLAADVERAKASADGAKGAENKARAHTAEKRAEADVVDKDREKWAAREGKKALAKEEEAAEEAWRPRRA